MPPPVAFGSVHESRSPLVTPNRPGSLGKCFDSDARRRPLELPPPTAGLAHPHRPPPPTATTAGSPDPPLPGPPRRRRHVDHGRPAPPVPPDRFGGAPSHR